MHVTTKLSSRRGAQRIGGLLLRLVILFDFDSCVEKSNVGHMQSVKRSSARSQVPYLGPPGLAPSISCACPFCFLSHHLSFIFPGPPFAPSWPRAMMGQLWAPGPAPRPGPGQEIGPPRPDLATGPFFGIARGAKARPTALARPLLGPKAPCRGRDRGERRGRACAGVPRKGPEAHTERRGGAFYGRGGPPLPGLPGHYLTGQGEGAGVGLAGPQAQARAMTAPAIPPPQLGHQGGPGARPLPRGDTRRGMAGGQGGRLPWRLLPRRSRGPHLARRPPQPFPPARAGKVAPLSPSSNRRHAPGKCLNSISWASFVHLPPFTRGDGPILRP